MRGTDKVHILAAFAVMRRKWFHFWRKCCDDYGWGFKLLFGGNVIMYSKGCGEILRKAWRTWKGGGCLIASSWQTCHKQQQTAREEIKTLEMSCKKWNEPVQYWCFLPHDSLLKCNMHVSIFTIWCCMECMPLVGYFTVWRVPFNCSSRLFLARFLSNRSLEVLCQYWLLFLNCSQVSHIWLRPQFQLN